VYDALVALFLAELVSALKTPPQKGPGVWIRANDNGH
jgi:hypothetical protein